MKKVLFGSTALVAVAFAGAAMAKDVTMKVGGYLRTGVGVGQFNDGDNVDKDFHIIRDGEIQFKGAGTLDNGLTIGVRVELEAFSSTDGTGGGSDKQIDESYMTIDGSFGRILIGTNDNAYYNVGGATGILGSSVGMGAWDGSYVFTPTSIGLNSDLGDDMAVHYYIPNIAGFEAGVSWSPTGNAENGSIDTSVTTTNSLDQLAIGVAYTAEFDGGSFTLGGGYITQEDTSYTYTYSAWGVGAELSFDMITIGARYEGSEQETAVGDTEVTSFGGGIVYATGPWEFGLNAVYSETDYAVSTDFEQLRVNAGVAYELGDGVALGLGVDYGDIDYANTTSGDEDGFGGALLLGVSF